ncbi:hypothetical protein BDFG_09305, partial [Blastomyces dermatitidis ATCC 26199]
LATSVSQLCNLFLIQLAFCVHSYKETFTILHHSFTNFSHSLIIFFISSSLNIIIIQDFYSFFCSTLSICSSITLYTFLAMASHSHNKCHHSAHTRQFVSKQCIIMNDDTSSPPSHILSSPSHTLSTVSLLKSSHVDRFAFINDSELNVESLIKNLKSVIMKKLSVSCVAESPVSSSVLSVSFSAALLQSSTPASVSGSPAPATSVSVIPGFAASAFIISSPHFKKMLCRLNESSLSRIISLLNSIEII